jgi:large subunit ribosomal protein L32
MPVPKRKRSRARRDSRFANKGLKIKTITSCSNCNNPLMPHTACMNCGFYKGAKVLATKADRSAKRIIKTAAAQEVAGKTAQTTETTSE